MRILLEHLEIPEEIVIKLNKAGIFDTAALLKASTFPDQREKLAIQSGASPNQILAWAGIADLLRIKSMQPAMAQVLVQRYPNVESIASEKPRALFEHLEQSSLAEHISLETARDIIEESKELKHQLVLFILAEKDFPVLYQQSVQETRRLYSQQFQIRHKLHRALFWLATLFLLVLTVTKFFIWPADDPALWKTAQLAELTSALLFFFAISSLIGLFAAVLGAALWTRDLMPKFSEWTERYFFNTPLDQRFFKTYLSEMDTRRHMRITRTGVIVLSLSIVPMLVLAVLKEYRFLYLPLFAAISIVIILILKADVDHVFQVWKKSPQTPSFVLQRFLIHRLVNFALVPLATVLVVQILKAILLLWQFVVTRALIPIHDRILQQLMNQINALPLQSTADQSLREILVENYSMPFFKQAVLLFLNLNRTQFWFKLPLRASAPSWPLSFYRAWRFYIFTPSTALEESKNWSSSSPSLSRRPYLKISSPGFSPISYLYPTTGPAPFSSFLP
ncbi:DUF4332 domain-containing protein [Ornatilinea apprima]|uniref:DUF4332 domain-containing protein n=1 Tax=Ornatilinea apprima TaxID=1134406 RepID=UPI0009462E60|nr:DUF4332 domain-containing protein [Ornatilinea apprima]